MVPPKKHLLRHQPANAQIGLMEGNTFCTTLQPRLFTMDLNVVEHKVFYTEVLKLYFFMFECMYLSNDGIVRTLIATNRDYCCIFVLRFLVLSYPYPQYSLYSTAIQDARIPADVFLYNLHHMSGLFANRPAKYWQTIKSVVFCQTFLQWHCERVSCLWLTISFHGNLHSNFKWNFCLLVKFGDCNLNKCVSLRT